MLTKKAALAGAMAFALDALAERVRALLSASDKVG